MGTLHLIWIACNGIPRLSIPEKYELRRQTGNRRSTVFEGVILKNGQQCAVKVLKASSGNRVKREIKILQDLRGGPNIIELLDVVRDEETKTPSLILEFVNNVDFRSLYPRFTDKDIQYYICEILKALDFCHSKGIMHRDIRPHNIVLDHERRKLRVVGWGSADFHYPGATHDVRVSVFKAPELLLDFEEYDFSVDMWSLGSMMASMVFRREPFFHGNSQSDQLRRIAVVLGTDGLFHFVAKHNIELESEYIEAVGRRSSTPLRSFVTPENQHLATDETLDLLGKLLRYDPEARLTAGEAQQHPYFQTLLR